MCAAVQQAMLQAPTEVIAKEDRITTEEIEELWPFIKQNVKRLAAKLPAAAHGEAFSPHLRHSSLLLRPAGRLLPAERAAHLLASERGY
jgi:hypothetical protein